MSQKIEDHLPFLLFITHPNTHQYQVEDVLKEITPGQLNAIRELLLNLYDKEATHQPKTSQKKEGGGGGGGAKKRKHQKATKEEVFIQKLFNCQVTRAQLKNNADIIKNNVKEALKLYRKSKKDGDTTIGKKQTDASANSRNKQKSKTTCSIKRQRRGQEAAESESEESNDQEENESNETNTSEESEESDESEEEYQDEGTTTNTTDSDESDVEQEEEEEEEKPYGRMEQKTKPKKRKLEWITKKNNNNINNKNNQMDWSRYYYEQPEEKQRGFKGRTRETDDDDKNE